MAKILCICHSTGDTQALLKTAQLLRNRGNEVLLLPIGEPAYRATAADTGRITLPDIIDTFPVTLTDTQEQAFHAWAATQDFSHALIGTPSLNHVQTAFQMAKVLTTLLAPQAVSIYNDYLYEEPAHTYWQSLRTSLQPWHHQVQWLTSLPAMQRALPETLQAHSQTVGHLNIDGATTSPNLATVTETRQALAVPDTHQLLFISGSKNAAEDAALLEAVAQAIAANSTLPPLAIRLGLHPGTADLPGYVAAMNAVIDRHPCLQACTAWLLPYKLISQFREPLPHHIHCEVSGEAATDAADYVASYGPYSLFHRAAFQRKPAFSLDTERHSFAELSTAIVGDAERFLTAHREPLRAATDLRSALNVPETSVAEAMVAMFAR
ncbi:MAG: hypothetical protein A3J38_09515 [Gammaproteobacteria bacterium RIFCSPHIGHO2_12_FULL_45_9]|nr:MAG: hypothetical protein A3J38_09515 [Gammaproteobacteria bacterium RIFCSPHIGHO2_12_FULL_45_9]